mmetsp:Transcript_15483/g.33654  ORF Transcript_15483/g.33654 Transcript_15483/m.33654 type:complete len:258 (-) Transcript_15483:22-795(-)
MTDGRKLFVGCLPYSKSEGELAEVFCRYGDLEEVHIQMKNGQSRGCAFVTFTDPQCASVACQSLQGFMFPGSSRGLNVSFAQSQGSRKAKGARKGQGMYTPIPGQEHMMHHGYSDRMMNPMMVPGMPPMYGMGQQGAVPPGYGGYGPPMGGMPWAPAKLPKETADALAAQGCKLFVGRLPFSRREEDILHLFQQYGPVAETHLLRDKDGQKTGAGFVIFMHPHHAAHAVQALDGFVFQGSTRPILVQVANERPARGS